MSSSVGTTLPGGASPERSHRPAIVVRGASVTLPVAYLQSADIALVERELAAKVAQAVDLFREAPLVLDLKEVEREALNIPTLLDMLRRHGLVPIAVRNGSGAQLAAAQAAGLGILRGQTAAPRHTPPRAAAEPATRERLFNQPVRSGQRLFVPNGDLVVVGQVNTGAEVLATGNVHVYGPLRGRAMAGVTGDTGARILTTCLEAQLVAIAGVYRALEDDVPPDVREKPAQVFLVDDRLVIEPLSLTGETARKTV